MAPAKKNEKSEVGEDFAEIRGYIADIRGSIAGIHEKLGLLDLIAQKVLGEDAGKEVEDVKKQEEPSLMGSLRNIDPIVKQIQRSSEEKKSEGEEIHAVEEIHVGGYLKSIDPMVEKIQQPTTILEVKGGMSSPIEIFPLVSNLKTEVESGEKVAEEDPFEAMGNLFHNEQGVSHQTIVGRKRNSKKKKKKRWKASLGNQEHIEKGMTSLSCEEIRNGVCLRREEVTQPHNNKKNREANMDIYACQVFVEKFKARKRVIMHYHLMECVAEKLNKKTGVHIKRHNLHKINKRFLLMATKRKKKRTRQEKREQRGIKPHKPGNHKGRMRKMKREEDMKGIRLELEFARCLWERTIAVKKLAKWRKRKSKQVNSKQWLNIKKKLCGKHNSSVCYSKLVCELPRKNFSGGRRNFYKKFYRMGDRLLLLNGFVKLCWGLWLAAKTSKRAKATYKRGLDGDPLWCVISDWTVLMIRLTKRKAKHKPKVSMRFSDNRDDSPSRTKIAELLHYHSIKSSDALTSLKVYLTGMKEGQNTIYGTNESKKADLYSPFMEKLKEKGYEVLYMVDASDEYVIGQLKEIEEKTLVSATKEGLKLEETEDERMMKVKVVRDSNMSCYRSSKETREINPENSIRDELRKRAEIDKNDKSKDLVLLFETALLTFILILDDSNTFGSRVRRLFKPGLNIYDEQMETRRVQLLPLVEWLSEGCVPAVPTAIQLGKTDTEADTDQEQHGFIKVLQKVQELYEGTLGSHGSVSNTQIRMVEMLCREEMLTATGGYEAVCWVFQGQEESILALSRLLQLFYSLEINLDVGFVEGCSSLEGSAYRIQPSTETRITVLRCQLLKAMGMTVSTLNLKGSIRLDQEEVSLNMKGLPGLGSTWEWQSSMEQQFLQYDLGDKVSFNGGSIDTIRPNTTTQKEKKQAHKDL